MYIDANTIIMAGAILSALAIIFGYLRKFQKWFDHQAEQDEKLQELETTHQEDIKAIQEENWYLMRGILACLKGLQEKGCNGPVTEMTDELEEYLNNKAHSK